MTASGTQTSPAVGFLTVCEHEGQGLFGGYLVLNRSGRPLEFHCTAPVRPGRAQEILYGPTLRPFLYGEQIGPALLEKGKSVTGIVFTDVLPMLAVGEFTQLPIVCIPVRDSEAGNAMSAKSPLRFDPAHDPPRPHGLNLFRFTVGTRELAMTASRQGDAQRIERDWAAYIADTDLHEPFARIREAIDEARRTAG